MTLKKTTLTTFLVFFISQAHAFCVYNNTIGNDTQRYARSTGLYNAPTVIHYYAIAQEGKTVNQLDYGCTLTKKRGQTDSSTVNIYRFAQYINDLPKLDLLCSVQVYNKGGYILVSGNKESGYRCDVHRDPN